MFEKELASWSSTVMTAIDAIILITIPLQILVGMITIAMLVIMIVN